MQHSWPWWISLLILGLVTIGCSSSGKKKQPTLSTPSGTPEVLIQSARIEPILAAAREFFAGRGYVETPSEHAYSVIFDRRVEGTKTPQALRVRLRGVPVNPTTWRLVGMSLRVEGWRTDFAGESLVPHGFPQVQEFLEIIKGQVEGHP